LSAEKPELLLPAGTLQNLKTAFLYGADAVYCGMSSFSLRSKSGFSPNDATEGIKTAHSIGKKVYIALNLYAHNEDLENMPKITALLGDIKPDGVIVSDSGVFSLLKKELPQMPICISTQANLTNWAAVDFWRRQGANKVVLARECSFEEIKSIRKKCPNIKIETFIHGAMCMSMSGRCLLSNFLSARDANRGECSQSCRWKYKLNAKFREEFDFALEEENRGGEFFEIDEIGEGSHILSSKDLCLMPVLDKYLQTGIDSFKIEGRHKNEFYTAIAAKAYRNAIDDWFENPNVWNYENYMPILNSAGNRGLTLGFHSGVLTDSAHDYETTKSLGEFRFAGIVRKWEGDYFIFEVRNTLEVGDEIEFILPNLTEIKFKLKKIIDAKSGGEISKVSAGQEYCIRVFAKDFDGFEIDEVKKNISVFCVAKVKVKGQNSSEKKIIENRKISFAEEICKK
jgi:putative protease